MRRTFLAAAVAAAVLVAAAPAGADATHEFRLEVLSSPPSMVTGGDALVRVTIPRNVPIAKATVAVNGRDVTGTLALDPDARTLTGMVDGLALGANTLAADSNGQRQRPARRRADAEQLPGHRADHLRPAAAAVRLQDRLAGTRPAARRQHAGDRLAARQRPVEQGLLRQPDRRVPLPHDDRPDSAAPARPAPGQRRPDDAARRPDGPVRDPPREGDDQPLHLHDRDPRAARRRRGRARRLALERAAALRLRRRRRDRAPAGDDRRRQPPLRPGPVQGLRRDPLDGHADVDALQPRARRRDGDHDEGAVHRGLRAAALHRRPRRLRRRDPAVRLRPEPPGPDHRRRDPAVLVPRHGHADDPRRRLRAARALHGRHRRRQPEVGHVAEPDVARGDERKRDGPEPVPRRRAREHRVRQGLARPHAARPQPALRLGRRGAGALRPGRDRGDQVDALGRPAQRLRRRPRRLRARAVGQHRRPVRARCADRREAHARPSS